MSLGTNRIKEIFVETFLDTHNETEIREFAYVQESPKSKIIRGEIEGTEYDLTCDDCQSDLIYNDKEEQWFCPFCVR